MHEDNECIDITSLLMCSSSRFFSALFSEKIAYNNSQPSEKYQEHLP